MAFRAGDARAEGDLLHHVPIGAFAIESVLRAGALTGQPEQASGYDRSAERSRSLRDMAGL